MARKEQMFDWHRRYFKNCWEGIKNTQKLLRQFPELKSLILSVSGGDLIIKGKSLEDLHNIRTILKQRIPWEDKIESKYPMEDYLSVHYRGQKNYAFVLIVIEFPYDKLPKGILGDCHIETEKREIAAYTSTEKSIVCPL